MVLPLVPLVAALWEQHKGGPPDSFANAQGDQSPDATAARNRINQIVNSGFGGQYQNPQVGQDAYKNPQNIDNLYDRIQKMQPSTVVTLHNFWEGLRNKIENGHNTFGPQIQKAIQEKWQGAAAQKTAEGIKSFTDKEKDLVSSAQLVSEKVKLVRSAVEITKPAAQPTPHTSWTSDLAGWVPGPTWKLNDHRKTQANAANEHLINNVFYPAVRESDTQVPLAPPPYNPVNTPDDNTGWKPSGVPPVDPPSKGPDDGHGPGDTNQPKPPNPDQGSGDGTTPTAADPSAPSNSAQNPASTTAASAGRTGWDPAAAGAQTSPSSVTPAGIDPRTGLPYGSGGPGVAGTSGGQGNSAGRGTSVPGSGVSQQGAARGAVSGAGKGAAGLNGLPGMMPPGAKSEKEDEKTHKSKISEELVSRDNGDELTGLSEEQRQKTVPPVLGE
ncbi:hypothetical protein [Nocardia mikamii]|uniref:hypothetical protein n=1 Tax=Nocardia mikamii TaxID=508464 RepID=UPI0007A55EF7|nr:hypothetical protein [Nocardia mikamii]